MNEKGSGSREAGGSSGAKKIAQRFFHKHLTPTANKHRPPTRNKHRPPTANKHLTPSGKQKPHSHCKPAKPEKSRSDFLQTPPSPAR
ncbi:hypothetical protein [Methanimicrococcus hongohii]|uniref:hypothetical protein n=1 Tax=Methanimicrococcus hongohii TaxID=3028295 RepID=UPI00292CF768|nr:hypothetical protein [Methanimicrococcus sp. Hf6]